MILVREFGPGQEHGPLREIDLPAGTTTYIRATRQDGFAASLSASTTLIGTARYTVHRVPVRLGYLIATAPGWDVDRITNALVEPASINVDLHRSLLLAAQKYLGDDRIPLWETCRYTSGPYDLIFDHTQHRLTLMAVRKPKGPAS